MVASPIGIEALERPTSLFEPWARRKHDEIGAACANNDFRKYVSHKITN